MFVRRMIKAADRTAQARIPAFFRRQIVAIGFRRPRRRPRGLLVVRQPNQSNSGQAPESGPIARGARNETGRTLALAIAFGYRRTAPGFGIVLAILLGVILGIAIALAPGTPVNAAPRTARAVPLPKPRPYTAVIAPAVTATLPSTEATPAAPKPAALPKPAAQPTAKPAAPPPTQARPAAPPPAAPAASAADLQLAKKAFEAVRNGRLGNAAESGKAISDPLARKLVEWAILRAEDDDFSFERYRAFIASNPHWPHTTMFRRKAEAALWQQPASDPATVRAFFAHARPLSAKGRLAYARALLALGDRAAALQVARETWRNDAMTADLERQALDLVAPLLTSADHKARMDRRFYAEDDDAGLRAAQRLGGVQVAIAKARQAVINKARNAEGLLDAVPQAARKDAGYVFSRIQWLRRNDKVAEAAQWMLAAPTNASAIIDPDEWWTERRLLARKLLDVSDTRTAYRVAREAVEPEKENAKIEAHFTAGWIALRFLKDPAAASAHFARIVHNDHHPTSLARGHYWLGRSAEAASRHDEARAHYQRGARYVAAYYGQLARARLGMSELALPPAPQPSPAARTHAGRSEIVRAAEILYAIDEGDFVVSMAADLSDRADADTLAMLADLATRRQDARTLLQVGKGALARGLPFEVHAFPTVGLPRYKPAGQQVDPAVAYAISRQESAFNPRAVSSAKAYGLMQVTAGTGKLIAKRIGVPFSAKRLLDDPAYNVQLGAAELGDVLETYRGSYILSFVAYNAGRRRVSEWIERFGDPRDPAVDPIDWVERIPFSETRNYVQRVLENMQVYRLLFGSSRKLLIEADLRRGTVAQ